MALNDSLRSLDAAVRSIRNQSEYGSLDRTADFTLKDDVTEFQPGKVSRYNLDETSAVLLAQEDSGVKALQILFSEFVNIYVTHSIDAQIWDEITQYEELCDKQLKMLQKLIRKIPHHHSSLNKTQEMKTSLMGERNTWRLLRSLFQERQRDQSFDENDRPMIDTTKNRTDKAIISQLYDSSASIREIQNVVDWLEENAKDYGTFGSFHPIEYFGDTHMAWENTLRARNAAKSGIGSGSLPHQLITSLDPDACLRQDKKLDELDAEEENRLLHTVFSCIRMGKIQEAQDICAKCGQHWRAATLEGWKLSHDPNVFDQLRRNPVEGNRYRDVWKSVAWKAASDDRLSSKERATYGALCGHLPAMLLVCNNFEDQLWAYFRTLVDQRMEETLRESSLLLRPLYPLPKDYPEEKLTLEAIFKAIESRIGSHNLSFYHQLQKFLILNDVDDLISTSHEILEVSGLSSHQLRCLTHLVLVLKRLGAVSFELEDLVTDIVHSSVKEAMERGDIEQVARYCAVLPETLQVRSFADFLVNVCEEHHRRHALKTTAVVGLDGSAIAATVVAKIRLMPSSEAPSDLASQCSAEDKSKIEAMDWLLFDKSQRAEALRQANALMRSFLVARKIASAKVLMKKIPVDSIDVIMKSHKSASGELPACFDNRIKEYLCYKAFLDGQDSFTDWFSHFHQKKPSAPAKPGANCTFQEQLSYDHNHQQYCAEHEKWKHCLDLITRKANERLYNVLLFPDGGWLVDSAPTTPPPATEDVDMPEDDSSSDFSRPPRDLASDMAPEDAKVSEYLGPEIASREPNRDHQMLTLRALYIPQVTSLLQKVLHGTEKFKECVQLADLIASEQHSLYKCFSSGEMQRFLFKMQDSCHQMLDSNWDSLGYPQR